MPEKKPFNDAVAHMQSIEGAPSSIEIKKLPSLLRYFGYFMAGFFGLSLLIILIGIFIQ
ncbi:amino acid transporter [Planococcus glaciei]|uniref:amino acid transporter n=1 Tax=Planococcus glaciei TaxID=459472 RepID=UPI001C73D559|nr:amino acid transporter [Planococcus glaciei]MBX0314131.1 amino acid transporter [Planococcus glaciei]